MDIESTHLNLRYPLIGFILVSASLLGVMGFLVYTGDRMAARHAPLVDAAMEIKLNATLGHLWFEEILSGDRNEKIQQVWRYLDEADWYASAMLQGGRNQEGTFHPLKREAMRATIESVRARLLEFRDIAQRRHQHFLTSPPGSEIDQEFDQVFEGFMGAADQVETQLQTSIAEDLESFRRMSVLLLTLSILVSTFIGYALYRLENQRRTHLRTIETAHADIQAQHTELNYLAHFDVLTELPNRSLFMDRLAQAVVHAQRRQTHVVLMFIDLDNFKAVNDRLGHPAGDQVLRHTGRRLRNSVRSEDTVARLSGDEFTIILSDIGSREQSVEAAKTVSRGILQELAAPFGLDGNTAFVTASIGIALYPDDGETADELLTNADRAMFEAKHRGKNGFHFHSKALNDRAKRLLRIENELRIAIDQDQLTLYYQPQWDVQDGSLAGIEALVRWNHPRDGLVQPGDFIPVAESNGLIESIDIWVLETACRQYQEWKQEGLSPGKLSVNLSPMLFRRPDLIRIISANAAETCMGSGELELELTESALLEDSEHTQNLLKQLRSQGIQLAIDDFGTGYSSMAYLRSFPADTLKIDRSFIQVIHQDQAADAILKNMVELARCLGMRVIAEGIETQDQERYVRAVGCHFAQGYRLARPMPAEQFRLLMISQSQSNVSLMRSFNHTD